MPKERVRKAVSDLMRQLSLNHNMEPKDYTLIKIEGEYAYLRPDDGGEDVFIALMLLPFGVDIGTRLHCEMFEYTVI